MFWRLLEITLLPIAWGASIYSAVSLQHLNWISDYSICGPWGCGPTTQALLAMHAGWFALLAPPLLYLPRRVGFRSAQIRNLGRMFVAIGLLGIAGLWLWQWLVWLPKMTGEQATYIWQRCGYVLAISVDWPLVEIAIIGCLLWVVHFRGVSAVPSMAGGEQQQASSEPIPKKALGITELAGP